MEYTGYRIDNDNMIDAEQGVGAREFAIEHMTVHGVQGPDVLADL